MCGIFCRFQNWKLIKMYDKFPEIHQYFMLDQKISKILICYSHSNAVKKGYIIISLPGEVFRLLRIIKDVRFTHRESIIVPEWKILQNLNLSNSPSTI